MKTIFYLAFFSQLPFGGPSVRPAISPQVGQISADNSATSEAIRQLEATTKSVMKRRVELNGAITVFGGEGGSDLVARAAGGRDADSPDDQVIQAAFQTGASDRKANGTTAPKNLPKNDASAAGKSTPGALGKSGGSIDPRAGDRASPVASDNGSASTANTASGGSGSISNVDAATRAAANASAALLASALAAPSENALDGRPVSLGDALGRGSAAQRLEIASLYWKLALASADYHWALDESLQLEALPANPIAVDSPLLATARAAAQAKTLEAKAAAVTAQQELADAIGQPTTPLPLVVEQPLVGPYRTYFDTIFASRSGSPPGRSRAIDRALPLWREAIDLRTAAVQAAASAVQTTEAAYGEKTAAVEALLYAHRELSQQRRAFLNAVREYNAEIVEYASYVAGPTTSTATILSMLTRPKPGKMSGETGRSTLAAASEPTPADPKNDPNVRQALAEEPMRDEQRRASENGAAEQAGTEQAGRETAARSDDSATPETELKAIDAGRRD